MRISFWDYNPRVQPVIKVSELARKLQTSHARIHALIRAGYLRKYGRTTKWFGYQLLYPPSPSTFAWIKAGFAPLNERPIVKVKEAAQMAQCSVEELRRLCFSHNIPIHADLAFGELLTVDDIARLTEALYISRDPQRFDRGAFLHFLRGVRSVKKVRVKPLPYSDKIENEIKRIARMGEPQRTIRAAAFIEAYRDAKTVADCLEKYGVRTSLRIQRVGRGIEQMIREITR